MRLTLPLLLSGALSVGLSAYADNMTTIKGVASGMSPDASLVVGTESQRGEALYTSFLYTVENNKMDWLTENDYYGSHLDGGRFSAVNNAGIIAGTVRNPDMRLPKYDGPYYAPATRNESDEEEGEAISSAAVWRDGKLYILGCGDYTIDFFSDSTDGSAAVGISSDGNIVYGNIISNWMAIEACLWEYDASTDSYEYRPLSRPKNAMISSLVATSDTGFPAIGAISISVGGEGFMTNAIWKSEDDVISLDLPDLDGAFAVYAHSISADGHYVTLSVYGKQSKFYIYDMESASLVETELPAGTTEVTGYTVTNDGNAIIKIQDSNWQSSLFYYDHASGSIIGLEEYLADTMPGLNFTGKLSSANIIATSGDGKNILLQQDSYGSESWLLTLDNPRLLSAPAPSAVDIYHTSLYTVEVKFDGIPSLPSECKLKGYKVYVDNEEVEEISVSETGGTYYVETDAYVGDRHNAYVCTVYTKNGEDKISGKSPVISTFVSSDLSLEGFYDFNDATVDEQDNIIWGQDTWQAKVNYGVPGEFINWHFTISDFENRTPAITVVSAATEPWSCLFVSHYMDATDDNDFYIDLRYLLRMVNTTDQDLSSDWLDVEASVDGKNWITVASVNASETTPYVWHTLHADLGELMGGEVFQLRINAHGEGIGQLLWMVDDIAIDKEFGGAQPTGLRYGINGNDAKLMWHNSLGMHDLSYLDNSSILWDYNVGNEGKPLIGAIELSADQIESFEGEYITAVSTFLYDDPSIEQKAPTTAEAIVYADGEEVARVNFDSKFNTVDQTVAWLDTPVLIEKGKTYRVGVRISNYAVAQAPMYYQASSACVVGRSDLYSEDEGRTWHNASEIAVSDVNPNGYCVWPIRAHIASQAVEATEASDVLYYDVFRDGVKINEGNLYEPHPWLSVPSPFEGVYTVQAHYKGGAISLMSDPLNITDVNGIDQIFFTLSVSTGHGTLNISGDCLGACLYDMSGRVVSSTKGSFISGIPAGIYILKADTPTGVETYKVIVK